MRGGAVKERIVRRAARGGGAWRAIALLAAGAAVAATALSACSIGASAAGSDPAARSSRSAPRTSTPT